MLFILPLSVFQRLFELGGFFIKGVDGVDNASLFGEGRDRYGIAFDFGGVIGFGAAYALKKKREE